MLKRQKVLGQQKGFTLIELLVTLVVMGIVIAIALPSFTAQMANSRSAALGEDFATAMNFARSEAVKRKARVSLCASSDGATCVAVNGWRDGFIAFVDNAATDNAAAGVLADSNGVVTILRVWEAQDPNAVITATQGAATTLIRFTRLGSLGLVSNNPVVVNAHISKCTSNSARRITAGVSGMVSMDRTACP